jgi:hypothetical protein
VHADDLFAGNGEQPERVRVAEIVLDEEGDAGQVGERLEIFGARDAGFAQPLGAQGLRVQDPDDGRV